MTPEMLHGAAVDKYAHTHQLPQLGVAELAHWLALHPGLIPPAASVPPVFVIKAGYRYIQQYSPARKWTKIGADCFAYRNSSG